MTTRDITLKESKGTFSLFKKSQKTKGEYNFSDIAALRKVLSNEKARMLSVIKYEKPDSLYSLSKKLGRNFKSVYEDCKLLQKFGFIELIEDKINRRRRFSPRLISDTITINIKL
jgi:predicted transcriptional regulator